MAFPIRFLIDECLSPKLVERCATADVEITHVNFRGLRQQTDTRIAKWCVENDTALVTNNARDFRAIYSRIDLHPGLIILLPSIEAELEVVLLKLVIDHVRTLPDLVNTLIEIDAGGGIETTDFPNPGNLLR